MKMSVVTTILIAAGALVTSVGAAVGLLTKKIQRCRCCGCECEQKTNGDSTDLSERRKRVPK